MDDGSKQNQRKGLKNNKAQGRRGIGDEIEFNLMQMHLCRRMRTCSC